MITSKRRGVSLDTRKQLCGYLFMIPFLIGFVFFFLSPLIFYVMMAFSQKHDGMNFSFTGLENIRNVLLDEPEYIVSVFNSLPFYLIRSSAAVALYVLCFSCRLSYPPAWLR